MDLQGSSVCLTALKYIGDIRESYTTIMNYIPDNTMPPSDLIDRLDDIANEMKKIDATVSVLPNVLNAVRNMFNNEFRLLTDKRRALMEQIAVRKMQNTQMNTNSILYNEECLLKDIYFSYDNMKSPGLRNLCSDEVIEPSDYSVYNLVKKFQNEGNIMETLSETFSTEWDRISATVDSVKSSVLSFRTMMNDGEFMRTLSQDDAEANQAKKAAVNTIVSMKAYELVENQRKITQMFQTILDLDSNYEIYQKAVDSYTSITLESLLDGDAGYEFGV